MAWALLTIFAVNFNACSEQSPVQIDDQFTTTTRPPGELKILKSKSGARAEQLFLAVKYVTVAYGGKVQVGDYSHGVSSLDFDPGDVSANVFVTFFWESTGLLQGGAQFEPHGTAFSNPVAIELSYKDADLQGISEKNIKIWYFNEDLNVWELVASEVDTVNKVVRGHINHFSRYALGVD